MNSTAILFCHNIPSTQGRIPSDLSFSSHLSVVTCHESSQVGTKLVFDHKGHLELRSPHPRQQGTTVSLQQLFYTLPVRHKEFQRNIKKVVLLSCFITNEPQVIIKYGTVYFFPGLCQNDSHPAVLLYHLHWGAYYLLQPKWAGKAEHGSQHQWQPEHQRQYWSYIWTKTGLSSFQSVFALSTA